MDRDRPPDEATIGIARGPDGLERVDIAELVAEGDERTRSVRRDETLDRLVLAAGIDRAQKWLDSLRQHAAQLDQTLADREKTEATIRLAYAQLAQQKELFIKQLASNKELLSMQLNSAEFLAGLRASMGLF